MYGSANSHTAILARTMNIPAVIGLGEGLAKEYDGHMAAIDGFTGTIYIDPDEETMKAMTEKREEDRPVRLPQHRFPRHPKGYREVGPIHLSHRLHVPACKHHP